MKFKYLIACVGLISCLSTYAQDKQGDNRRVVGSRYREQYSRPRPARRYRYRGIQKNDPYTTYKPYGQTWNWYPFYGDSQNAYYYSPRYFEYDFRRYNDGN